MNEVFDLSNVSIKDGSELLSPDHLYQRLLIRMRHLCWFLQIQEVLLLALQVIP